MNRCETMRNELKAYLDGQLPFLARQQIRRHLKRCVACREELSAMEQTGNQLQADAPTPLEASLRAKILASAGNVGPKPVERPKAPSKWRRKPLMAWAVAATALTAWCVVYPLTHLSQLQPSTPRALMAIPQAAMNRAAEAPQAGGGLVASSAPKSAPASTEVDAQMGGFAGGNAAHAAPPSAVAQGIVPPAREFMEKMRVMNDHSPSISAGKYPTGKDSIEVTSDYWRQTKRMGTAGEAAMRTRVAHAMAGEATKRVAQPEADVNGFVRNVPRLGASAVGGKTVLGYTQDADEAERTVHKEAQITVQVDNVEAKSEAVEQLVQEVGGYVADNNLNTGDDGLKTSSLTLKVPVAQFQSVLNQVARLGEVKAKSLSGQDLTEEISDEKQSEHTLREDIQSTQQQLTQRLSHMGREERMDTLRELRTQVAQKQARLKLLHKLGALSTISVELDEKPRPVPVRPHTSGFMNDMNETLHGAVQSMMQAARLPILTFIWILAYAPLWILLILGYRWAVRR